MFDRKKYKKFAKAQLKHRWGIAILVSFLIFAISYIFQIPSMISLFASDAFNELVNNPVASYDYLLNVLTVATNSTPMLVSIIQSIVTIIFTVAAIRVFIVMTRSPEPVKFNSFLEGLTFWGKAILGMLWLGLWIFLWTLIPMFVLIIVMTIVTALTITGSTALVISAAVVGGIAVLASTIPVIMKSYSYSQIYYVIAEHKNVSVIKALNISKTITKGHKWDLFVVDLSFIGWAILAAIPAGIGFIFLTPYMYLTEINAYHGILQESIEKGSIKPEDFAE